ncbi:MAG: ABC transporter ATP-binding protein [Eubacterium sp.]|nr:ABC transporter ATP-binding protein [Eubacterium sp.]
MIKTLMQSIGEYKRDSLLSPLFVVLEVVMEVIIPLLMANMIDYGVEPGSLEVILKYGVALVISTIVALIFGALSGHFAAKASAGYAKNLRRNMYYNIQNFSFYNIDRFSAASLVTRLTTDVTNVQNAYQMIIRVAIRGPVMLVFSLFMTFSISPSLSMIFLIAIVFLGIGLFLVSTKAHPIFERVFRTYDKLNTVVQENLRGIRVVKSFVREDQEIEKFDGVSEVIYKDFSKAEKILAFNSPMMQFAMYFCILAISWLGGHYIVAGDMGTGQLVSLIAYASQILISLMMLSLVFVMIIISIASAERIVEILKEESDLKNPENPVYTVENGDVDFDHVGFSYAKDPSKLSLSDVDLHIKSGETVGIIGGTGSSKSSLVQLIPRLYDATTGCVKVGGRDVRDYDIEALREAVAVVLQKNELFSGTIKENLRWGNLEASDEELVRVCKLAQADDFIQSFPLGYDTHIEQGGSNVSGGQKQRLCIARALLKKPKILILDDSTSAVDTKTDALIREAFREEIPDTTKFIIAQRITSVMDADKIIVMNGGKVEAVGNHDTLMAENAIYREVYESQNRKEGVPNAEA